MGHEREEWAAACRSCGCGEMSPILALGDHPLANAYLTEEQLEAPEARYPLDLVLCENCGLVQITVSVSPDGLFREYLYFSSFAAGVVRNAEAITRRLIQSRNLGPEHLVIEIASNDGYLLKNYKAAGVQVLGVEPARNIAAVAMENGIPTIPEFFGRGLAAQLSAEGKQADIIHANNVLAHVPDLNGFVAGFREVLKPNGILVIEVPYVKDLVDHCEFDTIYHEHLCYFSLTALDRLFRRHGLHVQDVERIPIHGGSLRVFAGKEPGCTPAVQELLEEEGRLGLDRPRFYQLFADRVRSLREDLLQLVHRLRGEGKRIAGYGAAAKGSILLNYCGIGQEILEFVVDRNTHKQGRYMPGVHVPIYGPDQLTERMPDYVLILAWNFAEDIMAQHEDYRRRGGQFLVPVPTVRFA